MSVGRPRAAAGLVALLALTLASALAVDRVGWVPYTLARDLPWAGFALAGAAFAVGRARGGCGHRTRSRGVPGRRGRGPHVLALGLTAVLTLAPQVTPRSELGLSLRLTEGWRGAGAEPASRVSGLSFDARSGAPWQRERFTAVVHGWLYAPVAGRYVFAIAADDGAVLELDGAVIAGTGRHPDGRNPPGRVDLDSGFHRLALHYVQAGGAAGLDLRWSPPHSSRNRRIPAEYLLPEGASAPELARRALLLLLRRVGVLLLAVLLAASLGPWVERAMSPLRPETPASPATLAVFALLFFLLADRGRLFPPDAPLSPVLFLPQPDAWLRPALLLALALGIAATRIIPGSTPRVKLPALVRRLRPHVPALAVATIQVVLIARFLGSLDGGLVSGDDHGSFLYRYHVLDRTFPRFISYDPWWNAGTVDETIVLSGATSVFLLTWPLVRLLSLETAYAGFIPLVGIVAAPWSLFAATRLLGFSRLAASLAALLALAPTQSYFGWLLALGTLPALLSAALAPLAFALLWRIFGRRDRRGRMLAALVAVATLASSWLLFPAIVVPAALAGGLWLWPRLGRRDAGVAVVLVAVILGLTAGWLGPFLATPAVGRLAVGGLPERIAWAEVRHTLSAFIPAGTNPIGLILGAAGIVLLPRTLRFPYGALAVWLVLVSSVGQELFGRLELGRFAIPLGFVLVPPAAGLAARALRGAGRQGARGVPAVAGLGLLVVLGVHLGDAWARYGNESHWNVGVMPTETRALVAWLRAEAQPGARVLFPGLVQHQYGGHVAYLQPLAGHPMLASGYYHSEWGQAPLGAVLHDPAQALRGEVLTLLNVRYVVVRDDDAPWISAADAAGLRRRSTLPGIAVYETDVAPTYLSGATGRVTFDYNRIAVHLDAPAEAVVVKFRWAEGLAIDPPLPMEPVEAWPGIRLIRIRPGGARAFEIRY